MSTFSKRHISIAAAFALLASGVTNLVAPSAFAADMLEEQQETTQVEYGTGWYLRGDISATATSDMFSSDNSSQSPVGAGRVSSTTDEEGTFGFGFGIGYRFSESLRADIGYRDLGDGEFEETTTFSPLRSPCTNSTSIATGAAVVGGTIDNCLERNSSSHRSQALMVNGYYDIDEMYGIRPFVGLGLGVIRNNYSFELGTVVCTPDQVETCNPTDGGVAVQGEQYTQIGDRKEGVAYHLAGAVHAGVAIPIGDDMYIDTSYSYTTMMDEATWGGDDGYSETRGPNDFHSLRVGLRIEIW